MGSLCLSPAAHWCLSRGSCSLPCCLICILLRLTLHRSPSSLGQFRFCLESFLVSALPFFACFFRSFASPTLPVLLESSSTDKTAALYTRVFMVLQQPLCMLVLSFGCATLVSRTSRFAACARRPAARLPQPRLAQSQRANTHILRYPARARRPAACGPLAPPSPARVPLAPTSLAPLYFNLTLQTKFGSQLFSLAALCALVKA